MHNKQHQCSDHHYLNQILMLIIELFDDTTVLVIEQLAKQAII